MPSTFATRFNDIGTPLTIFWSSRSSRTAKAAVPKYAKRWSDAITADRFAKSAPNASTIAVLAPILTVA
jgi:hypothetical protein